MEKCYLGDLVLKDPPGRAPDPGEWKVTEETSCDSGQGSVAVLGNLLPERDTFTQCNPKCSGLFFNLLCIIKTGLSLVNIS